MNKVVLKEQKKKEKDKEKKKESIRLTKEIIQERLLNHFRYCIGEGEKSTKEEIFQVVTGLNSLAVNSFSRFYWWESIEKVIRKLRKENKCFVIKKNGNFFVLKTENEAEYYKGRCKKAIEHMENAMERADDWVINESWKKLDDDNYSQNMKKADQEKKLKKPEDKIDYAVTKAEKKVIKVYKGESE